LPSEVPPPIVGTTHPTLKALLLLLLPTLLSPLAVNAQSDAPRALPTAVDATPPPSVSEPLEPAAARMLGVLAAEQGSAGLWYWGWTSFYGAVVIGQTVFATLSDNKGAQANAHINIVFSSFGLISTLAFPPPVVNGVGAVLAMPERTPAERETKTQAIRALFAAEVSKERFYSSPLNHIVGLAVNAGVSAYLYWALHLGGRALLNLIAGSVIWEAQIFTHPSAATRLSIELQKSSVQIGLVPLGTGVAVVGRF
jgi:hypothetical protein